ncbi:MAG: hypothetical protein ACI9U2_001482 [Bradymonadia bacterium]|jgi:hypothetical protein
MRHRPIPGARWLFMRGLLVLCLGCGGEQEPAQAAVQPNGSPAAAGNGAPVTVSLGSPSSDAPVFDDDDPPDAAVVVEEPKVGAADPGDIAPQERVLIMVDGAERYVSRSQAITEGYDLINFRNDWVPFIFQPMDDPSGTPLPNRYRRIFIGLANDKMDGDARKLPKGEKNFLEVFGIPPSLGVILRRYDTDADAACHAQIDYDFMATQERIKYRSDRALRKHKRKLRGLQKKIDRAMEKAGVETAAALREKKPSKRIRKAIDAVQDQVDQERLLAEIDKRLDCDTHNSRRFKHKTGKLDRGLRLAVRRFQRKHKIYEHTNLKNETMKTMAMPPVVTNHMGFRRVLEERVTDAAHLLEDGTFRGKKPPTFVGADGKTHAVRNLVKEFADAAMQQLGIDTPEGAKAFMERRQAGDFKWMTVGVKLPPRPEYYTDTMDLEIEIDRGDVFYAPPWDEDGKKLKQYRKRMPKFSVFTTYRDQRIRLAYWPTTIGGWRKEIHSDGHEYFAYKQSYVGKRIIKKIIAGPTWVPPESTPLRSLAKRRYVNGGGQNVVNYSELGPGYLSAYGLVAGYFTKGSRGYDQGIRAHGSSDYMSIRSPERYSHGCHRLLNHLSVRLYGFILNHRNMIVEGDQKLRHSRVFYHNGETFNLRLPTRGFKYTLDPPLSVKVLRGNLRGGVSRPIEGLVKIPDKRYPKEEEEGEEGADAEDAPPAAPGSGQPKIAKPPSPSAPKVPDALPFRPVAPARARPAPPKDS